MGTPFINVALCLTPMMSSPDLTGRADGLMGRAFLGIEHHHLLLVKNGSIPTTMQDFE